MGAIIGWYRATSGRLKRSIPEKLLNPATALRNSPAVCLLTRRFAENRMTSKTGTKIDVIALDGRKHCLFPSAPVGHMPDQGETTLGRIRAAGAGRMVLGYQGAAAVPAGDGQVRQDRGTIAGTSGLSEVPALRVPAGRRGWRWQQDGGLREYRA
jgi:hypothetical protein